MKAHLAIDIKRSIDNILSSTSTCPDRVVSSIDGNVKKHTRLQALLMSKPRDRLDKIIQEIVLNHAVASEKMGAGSLDGFINSLTSTVRPHMDGGPTYGKHADVDDINRLIDRHTCNARPVIKAMLREAISLAGFHGRIIVEKTKARTPSVELVCGYTFTLVPCFVNDFSFSYPRVACIDGYVESVSEIHHLLEEASSAKEPLVMVSRGASDDVINTLKVNHSKGTLNVIPLFARFDLEGMNTLVDIAIVSGTDVVSSTKGNLISSLDYSSLPRVQQVTSFKGTTVFQEYRTTYSVAAHVARLRDRRVNTQEDEISSLLDDRIRSLSPNHVVLRIVDDVDFITNSQAVDRTLRSVKSCIERGIDETGEPVTACIASQYHAMRCKETLDSIGAALV